MDLVIEPRRLSGRVTPPPSKSMTHRLLIAAGLADGESVIRGAAFSQDIEATLRCLRALGAEWEADSGGDLRIRGVTRSTARDSLPEFDCGESGSTLRFFIPIALVLSGGGRFTGRGRLMERPQQPYFDLFAEKGIVWRQKDGELTVQGRLTPGEYRLAGNVSSQFFTGLLFALSLLEEPSRIVSTTAVESGDYIRMTQEALKLAGGSFPDTGGAECIPVAPFSFRPFTALVEADWSQAAFWYAAAFADNAVTPEGLNPSSSQGDKAVGELYWRLARPGEAEIDLSGCPDLLPPLAVMAAVRSGETRFTGAARLRLKESDRLKTTAALLRALGGTAEELPDGLVVRGQPRLTGGTVDGANDHRIVMAAAVAATVCDRPVTILGAEAVEKSYPTFFDDYQKLGGIVHGL